MSAHRIDQMLAAWFGVKDTAKPAGKSQDQAVAELLAMLPEAGPQKFLTSEEYLNGVGSK